MKKKFMGIVDAQSCRHIWTASLYDERFAYCFYCLSTSLVDTLDVESIERSTQIRTIDALLFDSPDHSTQDAS